MTAQADKPPATPVWLDDRSVYERTATNRGLAVFGNNFLAIASRNRLSALPPDDLAQAGRAVAIARIAGQG